MTILLTFIIVALAFSYWYWRHLKIKEDVTKFVDAQERERNRFHCVEIKSSSQTCTLARQYSGIRYLSAEAPRLPLTGCTATKCGCRYVHHSDRRMESRRLDYGSVTSLSTRAAGEERRRALDRRQYSGSGFKPRIVS